MAEIVGCVFRRNLPCHAFNFIGIVVRSIASPMLDAHEGDRAKSCNEGVTCDKDVSAVGRLEYDAKAGFCHDRVKVTSNWTLYLSDARVRASLAPNEELPNFVLHGQPVYNLALR
jgi:hypothetical protein